MTHDHRLQSRLSPHRAPARTEDRSRAALGRRTGRGRLTGRGRPAAERALALQQGLRINHVPSGDFSLYDHVLDTACMVGAIPPGYGWSGGPVSLADALRPRARLARTRPALEMTKWFDTNYHYLVPRLSAEQRFQLTDEPPARPVPRGAGSRAADPPGPAGPGVLPAPVEDRSMAPIRSTCSTACCRSMRQVLRELAEAGVAWVQIDEPVLALDLSEKARVGSRAGVRRTRRAARRRTSCSPAISARWATISAPRCACPSPDCTSIWRAVRRTSTPCWKHRVRSGGCRWA